jgi:hypothetical protein
MPNDVEQFRNFVSGVLERDGLLASPDNESGLWVAVPLLKAE